MLKKAGLVVAASAASLLAVSPLAFAGDTGYDVAGDKAHEVKGDKAHEVGHDKGHGHHKGHGDGGSDQNSSGFVNALNGNNLNAPIQACNNDIQGQVGLVPVQDVAENPTVPLNGALGLLGNAEAKQQNDVDNTRACGQESGGAGYGNG